MREMKDSNISWIGDIPADWDIVRLKHCSWLKGRIGWQGLRSSEFIDEGPYLITGTDLCNGNVNWSSCAHISEERYKEDSFIHVKEGDLLISKDGTIGKVAIAVNCPEKVSLNSGVFIIRNTKSFKYDYKYLYYILMSAEFKDWFSYSNSGNSTILHLTQEQFYNFAFAFPSIKEQHKIASYLDVRCNELDCLISDIQTQIDTLEQYKKSVVTEVITRGLDSDPDMTVTGLQWVPFINSRATMIYLKSYSYMKGRIGWQGLKSTDFIDEGPFCITGTDFDNGSINWNTCYHVSKKRYDMDANIHVNIGDLLITKDGTVGKLAKITSLPDKACLNSHLLIIRPLENKFTNEYLYYVLSSNIFTSYAALTSRGTTMDSLSQAQLGGFKFPIYSLEEQKAISEYLDEKCLLISQFIDAKKKQLETLEAYKKSLIYEYVTGKKEVINE